VNRRGRPILSVKRRAEDYPPGTPQQTPCRIWQGVLDKDGYGYVMVPTCNSRQRKPAHRWVWEQAHGKIPPRMVVRHRCDNPPCFRLTHLELGSVADNNRDARERKRHWSPPALSPMQSWRVLELLDHGWQLNEIAECYGVSAGTVRRIERLGPSGLEAYLKEMDHGDMDAAPTVHRDQDVLGVIRREGVWSTPWQPHEWQRPAGR
jgi:hypothetical protein